MEKVIHLLPSVLSLTAFICEVRWLYKIIKADSIIGGAVCSIIFAKCFKIFIIFLLLFYFIHSII